MSKKEDPAPIKSYKLINDQLVDEALKKDKVVGKEDPAPIKSCELINDQLVNDALKKDKGEAELLSWKIKPFTNKGDNYCSIVVGIEVYYLNNSDYSDHSYVAKVNPLRPDTLVSDTMFYTRKITVLSSIVGGMNNLLEQIGLDPVRAPKLFSQILETNKEVFITENLRIQGFKMYDKLKGMDLNHSQFVVRELGRFHASSLIFEETLLTKSIPDTFNDLKTTWLDLNEEGLDFIKQLFSSSGEVLGNFMKAFDPKFEKCSKWLHKHGQSLTEHYFKGYKTSDNKFDVLIHGDCWTNNMLFKYNEDEIPVDFRFLDFQHTAKASAASDLNYFFFTSLFGDFRRKNLNTLTTTYYESFSEIFRRAEKQCPFSYLELKQEIHNCKMFGIASALLSLQFTLAQGEEVAEVEELSEDTADQFNKIQMKIFEKMLKQEGSFRDRNISIFDDILDTNFLDEN